MTSEFLDNTEGEKEYLPRAMPNFDTNFNNFISIFGLTLQIEDLLIIALALLLLSQENCDFILVVALLSILI